jgi:hypothetical protein
MLEKNAKDAKDAEKPEAPPKDDVKKWKNR